MPELVVCLPTSRVPYVASVTRQAICGHEVYVSAALYPTLSVDASFLCIECAAITPDFAGCELPEVAVLEARRWWADRRKES